MGASIGMPTFVKMKTGTYLGDGNDNRNIDIGVNLFSKAYCYVMVWTIGAVKPMFYCTPSSGDLSYYFDEAVSVADGIQALTNTGFQIGQLNEVNQLDVNYMYLAVWQLQHISS